LKERKVLERLAAKKETQREEPSSLFQRHRVDMLLAELTRKFPIPVAAPPHKQPAPGAFIHTHFSHKHLSFTTRTHKINIYNINKIIKHPASQKQNTNTDPQHRKQNMPLFYTVKKKQELAFNFQNAEHSTKLTETTSTDSQIQLKWHLPNEMLRLRTKIHTTNCKTFHTRYKEHTQAITDDNSNSGYSNHKSQKSWWGFK
jgi:hypothetical protein